jgi:hypothetical protein
MICDTKYNGLSIDFQNADELWPVEAGFEYGKGQYSSLYCTFDSDTASEMKNDDRLNSIQRAVVKIGGKPVKSMYYKPSFLKVGPKSSDHNYSGFLELHDLHENLRNGSVVYAPSSSSLEETFGEITRSVQNPNLHGASGQPPIKIKNDTSIKSSDAQNENLTLQDESTDFGVDFGFLFEESDGIEAGNVIHFDGESPYKALKKAKRLHGVDTHVDKDGSILVGGYPDGRNFTASNTGTNVDFHIKSSSLSSVFQNLNQVLVKGPTIFEGGTFDRSTSQNSKLAKSLLPGYGDKLRVHLRVYNENRVDQQSLESTNQGAMRTISAPNIDPLSDNLIKAGKRYFRGVDRQIGVGSVDFNIDNSNISTGKLSFLQVGSQINIKSIQNNCLNELSSVVGGNYYVYKVNHTIENGWTTSVDIGKPLISESDIGVELKLYDVSNENTMSFRQVFGYPYAEYLKGLEDSQEQTGILL